MELVLAHRNMDFDCLASQVAVAKLHPAVCIVPAHPLSQRIRSFLALYRDQLPVVDLQYVDWSQVKHVYIVDCQKIDRLDDRARKCFLEYKKTGEFTVYDHHDTDDDSLLPFASANSVVKKNGSAASIVLEKLREREIKLSSFEATVIAAGIYEDTGCLTHLGSTESDALGIAYCLKHGADLARIQHIIRPMFDETQLQLFEQLKKVAEQVQLNGARITICCATTDKFVDGLAELSSRVLENFGSDALVALVQMKDRIYLVSRSESAMFDLRRLAQQFGGGGHGAAASAVVKGLSLAELREKVIEFLKTDSVAERTAAKVMTSPVRTIRSDISMDEAGRIMLRNFLDGLVVMDEHEELVGVISKRDIDKARHHKLGHAPVRGFMSRPVISVRADSSLSEVQAIMVAEDIGRLPVLDDDGKLLGIVGRRELLAALYGDDANADLSASRIAPHLTVSGSEQVLGRIDEQHMQLYSEIGTTAASVKMVAYLVGGCVRDLVLDRENFDLDFVVEGSARQLARALVERLPQSYELVVEHERFDTATLYAHSNRRREVDIATARTEYYEYPAALPTVEPSSLEQDLFRRDFTINALALCLHPDRFGEILDYYGGMSDLSARLIRVLHPFSFIEDPTRIVRAARFAARLNFSIEPRTKLQAERAIQLGIFDNLGGVRLKEELRLILESEHRITALDLLAEMGGGLRFLESTIEYGKRVRLHLRRAEKLLANYSLKRPYIVYLGVLIYQLQKESLSAALSRLHLGEEEIEWILDAKDILEGLIQLEPGAKRSALYHVLHGYDEHSLAIAVSVSPMASHLRRSIKTYFEELKDARATLRGDDLIRMGVAVGPEIGRVLGLLLGGRLDGELQNVEDEKSFVTRHLHESQVPKL